MNIASEEQFLLKVSKLCCGKQRHLFRKPTYTIKDVDFTLLEGESLALLGSSSAELTELISVLGGLKQPNSGEIRIGGVSLGELKRYRARHVRMIFQNPSNSLNPSMTVRDTLTLPLVANSDLDEHDREKRIIKILRMVGLTDEILGQYPRSMSLGQKKRVSFARALILEPKILLIDKSIAAFDPNLRANICNLLISLRREKKITTILATPDLDIAKHICDKLLVMHNGEVIEYGNTMSIMASPKHDVTKKLIANYYNKFRYSENS